MDWSICKWAVKKFLKESWGARSWWTAIFVGSGFLIYRKEARCTARVTMASTNTLMDRPGFLKMTNVPRALARLVISSINKPLLLVADLTVFLFAGLWNSLCATPVSAVKLQRSTYLITSFMLPGLSRYLLCLHWVGYSFQLLTEMNNQRFKYSFIGYQNVVFKIIYCINRITFVLFQPLRKKLLYTTRRRIDHPWKDVTWKETGKFIPLEPYGILLCSHSVTWDVTPAHAW